MAKARIQIIPNIHGKITPNGKISEPDIYYILEKWLERHPEIKNQKERIRISSGRFTLPEGYRTDLVDASIAWGPDIDGYDPSEDADLYEYYLAEDQGDTTGSGGPVAETHKRQQLKLGKGVDFVKSHLRLLPQSEDIWEADIRPAPAPGNKGTIWEGMVISKDGRLPSERVFEEPATVNDMARLLADAMRRPLDGEPRRPKTLRIRKRKEWAGLLPHLKQIGIQVISAHAWRRGIRSSTRCAVMPRRNQVQHRKKSTLKSFIRQSPNLFVRKATLRLAINKALDSWPERWIMVAWFSPHLTLAIAKPAGSPIIHPFPGNLFR